MIEVVLHLAIDVFHLRDKEIEKLQVVHHTQRVCRPFDCAQDIHE